MITKTNFRVGDRVKINPKKSYNQYAEYALGKAYVIHYIFGDLIGYPTTALLREEGDISGGFIEPLEALELVEPDTGICEKEELRKEILSNMKFPRDIADYCVNDVLMTMKAAETKNFYSLNVSKIIFNPPATIVFWEDGTKTVVECAAEDEFSEYYGFLAALGKKVYENNSQIKKLIDKKAERHENKKDEKDISDVSMDSLVEALEYLFHSARNIDDGGCPKSYLCFDTFTKPAFKEKEECGD